MSHVLHCNKCPATPLVTRTHYRVGGLHIYQTYFQSFITIFNINFSNQRSNQSSLLRPSTFSQLAPTIFIDSSTLLHFSGKFNPALRCTMQSASTMAKWSLGPFLQLDCIAFIALHFHTISYCLRFCLIGSGATLGQDWLVAGFSKLNFITTTLSATMRNMTLGHMYAISLNPQTIPSSLTITF